MLVTYDSKWANHHSSWWAKVNRAQEHIESLRQQVESYRSSEPYSLTPEPTEKPNVWAYRLKFSSAPVPVSISTTVGDVLNNLRTALESLAYEIASHEADGRLTLSQEGLTKFPIRKDPTSFDAFFKGKQGALYGAKARAAFRAVQPFVNHEHAHRLGVSLSRTYEDDFRWSELNRLNTMWNIDKHRRLTVMTWRPNLIHWPSDGESQTKVLPGDGTVADGSVLLYLKRDREQGGAIGHEFSLVLTDDPGYSGGNCEDVVELLTNFYRHIVEHVFPRIFTIMSQDS